MRSFVVLIAFGLMGLLPVHAETAHIPSDSGRSQSEKNFLADFWSNAFVTHSVAYAFSDALLNFTRKAVPSKSPPNVDVDSSSQQWDELGNVISSPGTPTENQK
jgi:hypothetical protein